MRQKLNIRLVGWASAFSWSLYTRFALLLIAGITAAALFGLPATTSAAESVENQTKAPLDGMSFRGGVGPYGQPHDVEDRFVFANGEFFSKECEQRCEYPARPYFIRKVGDQIEFISETKCPYKDATIVWRGSVQGDKIEGVATWTINRWYWTVEKKYEFSGSLEEPGTPLASSD